jgi:hypothetical protein
MLWDNQNILVETDDLGAPVADYTYRSFQKFCDS